MAHGGGIGDQPGALVGGIEPILAAQHARTLRTPRTADPHQPCCYPQPQANNASDPGRGEQAHGEGAGRGWTRLTASVPKTKCRSSSSVESGKVSAG